MIEYTPALATPPRRPIRRAQQIIIEHMARRAITRYELARRMKLKRKSAIYAILARRANAAMLRRMAAALRLHLTDEDYTTNAN